MRKSQLTQIAQLNGKLIMQEAIRHPFDLSVAKVRERAAAVRQASGAAAIAALLALVGYLAWPPATYFACGLLGWAVKTYADARRIDTRFTG